MKKLRESSLRVGDIILTTSTSPISKGIRKKTHSDISHAMIYVQGYSVIDATGEGVQARNTQRLFYDDKSAIHVYRLRRDLTDAESLSICNYVRAAVGTEYATREAIRSAYGGSKTSTRKQFCSRLAARAYDAASISIVKDPHYCTPDALKHSVHLVEVPDVTHAVTQEEFDLWTNHPDSTKMMRDAINDLLAAARKRNRNIQNGNDIIQHLVSHPEDDDYMCWALEASSYLKLWKTEMGRSPWQYDLALLNEAPASADIAGYCRTTVTAEASGPHRYIVNRGASLELSKQYPRRYFSLMLELYEILANLHRRRVDVARQWLENRNLIAPMTATILRPHSPEWFAALSIWNPQQAAMTKLVTDQMRSLDVCSVCGDDPAKDHWSGPRK